MHCAVPDRIAKTCLVYKKIWQFEPCPTASDDRHTLPTIADALDFPKVDLINAEPRQGAMHVNDSLVRHDDFLAMFLNKKNDHSQE